jgi:hypothetical protein
MRFVLLLALIGCKAEEPKGATIAIDGKSYPLASAVAHGSHLALSTGTMDCTNVPIAEVMLSQSDFGWTLGGSALANKLHTAKADAMKDVTLTVESRVVSLGGHGSIGGMKVELSGAMTVLDCPLE